jgi:ribonuclease BN (tRNA processing enzyme)
LGVVVALSLASGANADTTSSGTRLILLGTQGGPVFNGNRAQPANLLVVGDTPYLIDAGNGVARQLALAHIPFSRVHQIFITHNHDDHNADWGTLMGLAWSTGSTAPVTVYGPKGTRSMLHGFLEYFAPNAAARYLPGTANIPPEKLMHAQDIEGPGLVYQDDKIRVTAVQNCHYHFTKGTPGYDWQQSFAFRFQSPDRIVVFSGDTGPCGNVLTDFAKGADVLVHEVIDLPAVEAALPKEASPQWRKGLIEHLRTEHSSPEEVGRTAAAAGVKRVVLTHIAPGVGGSYLEGVKKFYDGPVMVGQDLMEY